MLDTTIQTDTTFAVATAPKRNSLHWTNDSVTWSDLMEWVKNPASEKESGNYVLGTLEEQTTVVHRHTGKECVGTHRGKHYIVSRSAIALDIDSPTDGFFDMFTLTWPYAGIIHTTHNSTTENPRYRLILPLDRDVSSEEYVSVAEAIIDELGRENFDATSSQPERYMFRPSTQDPAQYQYDILDGAAVPSGVYLERFKESIAHLVQEPQLSQNKRDPMELADPIGAFNRAYAGQWGLLFKDYDLPYRSAGVGRWTYTEGESVAGVTEVSESILYSHHHHDPIANRGGVSAFDLVRIHKYGELDKDAKPNTPVNRLPSQRAMQEEAVANARAIGEMMKDDFDEDFDEPLPEGETAEKLVPWHAEFIRSAKTGRITDDIFNWRLIVENDPVFRSLYFNELSLAIETENDLPWRKVEDRPSFSEADRSSLVLYLEERYGMKRSKAFVDDLLNDRVQTRRRNPVVEYLSGLKWDGVPRLEESLPGVEPTEYTRMVARKSMVAAVARMFDPGCKWDHMLVLYGKEGLGKSFWIEKMSRGFSAPLGNIRDKDTLITMQRSWIITSDEGHAMKSADFDTQKEFLTRREDIFRMPYERESQVHPRHCVIWGTTNDEVFLRRQEGNRRFLIVRCENKIDIEELTDEYIDQVWAEAVQYYESGELLYLTDEEEESASEAREQFMDEDTLFGLVTAYVETPVPDDWWDMSPESRQLWMMNRENDFGEPAYGNKIDKLCSIQVWVEVLGRRRGEHSRQDLLRITEVLKNLPGWQRAKKTVWVPGYGPQSTMVREDLI